MYIPISLYSTYPSALYHRGHHQGIRYMVPVDMGKGHHPILAMSSGDATTGMYTALPVDDPYTRDVLLPPSEGMYAVSTCVVLGWGRVLHGTHMV